MIEMVTAELSMILAMRIHSLLVIPHDMSIIALGKTDAKKSTIYYYSVKKWSIVFSIKFGGFVNDRSNIATTGSDVTGTVMPPSSYSYYRYL